MSGRKRKERGIFGIVKKKSVLFSFNPRKGDECSSDSDDSDYYPGRQSTDEEDVETCIEREKLKVAKKKVKKAASLPQRQTSKRSRKELPNADAKTCATEGSTPRRLPPEVLLRVFLYGAQSEGITRFLPRVSRVCKEWHDTASDPSLLRHLDLSLLGEGINFTRQRLDLLLSTRDLSQCQTLNLAGQVKLSVTHIKIMLERIPRVASLDLRGCNVNPDMLKKLPELTPCLERIDLSCLSPSSYCLTFGSVEGLVRASGSKLVELRLGGMVAVSNKLQAILNAIITCCPLLEELDLSRPPSTSISLGCVHVDMGKLARACPRLTELRLDGRGIADEAEGAEPYSPAFPRLKIYSQSSHLNGVHDNPAFYRMFADSELSELNMSHTNLKPSKISRAESKVLSVKRLNLSNMLWARGQELQISSCMFSWFESIEILDLSSNKMDWFNEELSFFSLPEECARSRLRAINLSNSVVDNQTVINILKNCKSLQTIDLTACRELPRGCKRIFCQQEFSEVIKSLSA